MAWGIWNKIKNGLRKAGNWVKNKVLKPVVDKVIKPFKPIIQSAASAINPKLGAAVGIGMGVAEKLSDGGEREALQEVGNHALQWASKRFGKGGIM